MKKDIALAASNILFNIELCDDVLEQLGNIAIDLELTNNDLINILEAAKQSVNNYKNVLELKLEEL